MSYGVTLRDAADREAVRMQFTTCLVDVAAGGQPVALPDTARTALSAGGERHPR